MHLAAAMLEVYVMRTETLDKMLKSENSHSMVELVSEWVSIQFNAGIRYS